MKAQIGELQGTIEELDSLRAHILRHAESIQDEEIKKKLEAKLNNAYEKAKSLLMRRSNNRT